MAVEDALENYPKEVKLENGTECAIRPLTDDDRDAIREFYLTIPEHERLFIKNRMTDGSVFHEWRDNIDYESNLPLLVVVKDITSKETVIAEGALHQRNGGWKCHIGLVSMVVHPKLRNIGISKLLIREIVYIARHCGLQRLEVEFNGERKIAIKSFARIGFEELVRLPDYVQDLQAQYHDYVLMGMPLLTDEEYAGVGG